MEERPFKYSIKISIESRKSNLSSCRSLERPSWGERQPSLSKNPSFIEVMSLESGRKSDLLDKLLAEEVKPPSYFRQSLGGNLPSSNSNVPILERQNSDKQGIQINHTCSCYSVCEGDVCPCFQATSELCLEGYCCQSCIENKNAMLRSQNTIQKYTCTCKKTKCNKKYCSCFAAGVKCGPLCSCQNCINCDRISSNMMIEEEEDSHFIDVEELDKMEMPEKMDFEPVQFRYSNNL